ncbi:hypothetical protein HPP92_020600 [Vanilla planifolia]|uniref:Uncharacterized protein n=1 Tax=Vanilla planifolia TaxID=51239 RepID=A0A835UM78_VANPL|nr:hypothetical protein HPP92_020600 [Vanilla planifolia]
MPSPNHELHKNKLKTSKKFLYYFHFPLDSFLSKTDGLSGFHANAYIPIVIGA